MIHTDPAVLIQPFRKAHSEIVGCIDPRALFHSLRLHASVRPLLHDRIRYNRLLKRIVYVLPFAVFTVMHRYTVRHGQITPVLQTEMLYRFLSPARFLTIDRRRSRFFLQPLLHGHLCSVLGVYPQLPQPRQLPHHNKRQQPRHDPLRSSFSHTRPLLFSPFTRIPCSTHNM